MTDEQKQRLLDLQNQETLTEEEKPVLDALLALQNAYQALDDAKASAPLPVEDPVVVAQDNVDSATTVYNDAEVALQAILNPAVEPSVAS